MYKKLIWGIWGVGNSLNREISRFHIDCPSRSATVWHGDLIHDKKHVFFMCRFCIVCSCCLTKCKSRRLSSHQCLPSTQLTVHRTVNIEAQSFRVFYGARGELKRKLFENLFYLGVCGFPKFPNKCWYKMQSSWALLGLP